MSFIKFYLMWASSTWFGLMYQKPYCKEWDAALGALLEKHWDHITADKYTATLGSVEVWASNAFYSYGHIWLSPLPSRRPGFWNMYRLWLAVDSKQKEYARREREEYARKMREVANG